MDNLMYDNEADEAPRAVEPNEWDIPDLALEFKGEKGTVQFRSLEDLGGGHVERIRSVIGSAKNGGDATNAFYREALTILITGWDIPGKPHQAIPKGDARALTNIPAVVKREIERHVKPYLDRLMQETDGDPSQPASA